MNRLSKEKQILVAALLVEGNSLRGTARILNITTKAVLRNMVWIGEACQRFHDEHVHGLKPSTIEADEAWGFIHAKNENLPACLKNSPNYGDVWTWISIDPDSKFIPNWHIGKHTLGDAQTFLNDLARRIPVRFQLNTDQLVHYRSAVEEAFGDRVDYATIRKIMHEEDTFFGTPMSPDGKPQRPNLRENRIASVFGNPDMNRVTTTSIESQNTRLRTWNRRYMRNTICFSREIRNMRASLALHFTFYNFCRIPRAIRCTPAMEAGLTDHIWHIGELLEKINVEEGREVGYLN